MHELAICQALMQQVETIVADRGGTRVREVVVKVGALSGVDAGLLARAFTVARAGTCAASARLTLVECPLEVRCRECGHQGPAVPNRLLCGACGDWRVQVLSGEDLVFQRIVMEATQRAEAPPENQETNHV